MSEVQLPVHDDGTEDSGTVSLAERAHSHHWLIETPKGPTVTGTCKTCGESRTFSTALEENLWHRQEWDSAR